ncbi:MAG: hypothetical protein KDD22_07295 [Bdellovibrionales bacterium]|nr:hypothetical protein [Bdellovibrionales bacterium]
MEKQLHENFEQVLKSFHPHPPADVAGGLLKVRCPQCLKLYSIRSESISEPKPQFECTACKTQFWIPFPESLQQGEVLGFAVSWLDKTTMKATDSTEAGFKCENCGHLKSARDAKCESCGQFPLYLQEKEREVQDGFRVPEDLRSLWRQVIDDYGNISLHDRFIQLCKNKSQLDYAAYRYSRVLKSCPADEISEKMVKQIHQLLSVQMKEQTVTQMAPAPTAMKSKSSSPKRLSTAVAVGLVAIGSLLVIGGCFLPNFRNLVGVGAAFFFMAVAIHTTLNRT